MHIIFDNDSRRRERRGWFVAIVMTACAMGQTRGRSSSQLPVYDSEDADESGGTEPSTLLGYCSFLLTGTF